MRRSLTLSCLVVSLGFLGPACQGAAGPDPEPETCSSPLQRCAGRCVDTSEDSAHCGACNEDCPTEMSCKLGKCVPEGGSPCEEGWLLCGADCVSSASDRAHCGACDRACEQDQSCIDGSCVDSPCEGSDTLCNEACVDTQDSNEHCGGCDQLCDAGERCEDGACLPEGEESCTGEAVLCDGRCVDLQSNSQRCGKCDRSCDAEQACAAGTCVDLPCEHGERCGGRCVDLDADEEHCGECDNLCPGTSLCIEGSCTCTGGLDLCAEGCVDTILSTEHCGGCDNACPAPDERIAGSFCGWGQCMLTCRNDFGNCDEDVATGCEVDFLTSSAHCGRCDNDCLALGNVGPGTHCDEGACKLDCLPDFANCDEDPDNGCENDLRSSMTCGSCQKDCTQLPNVKSVTCDEGACVIESCAPGHMDDDEDPSNGCEAGLPAPSCSGGGEGRDDCGPDEDESCCLSLPVSGGVFDRANNASAPATVSPYRLDKYLVTVGRYRRFVEEALDKGWTPPAGAGKHLHVHNGQGLQTNNDVSNPTYESGWDPAWNTNLKATPGTGTWDGDDENRPVNVINWFEAYAFCIWDGGFLASEAEWYFAAACGSEQRAYPWGSATPTSNHAVYSAGTTPQPVGSKPLGAGCFGHLDLAGNGNEWIADGAGTYLVPCTDCSGVLQSTLRGPRGGSSSGNTTGLANSYRSLTQNPTLRATSHAIRCARAP